MKFKYRETTLNKKSLELLEIVNKIIDEYLADNYRLTLRQLYYQLVSRDIIANKDTEYKKVGKLIREGRMAGIVDWFAIEDRLRGISKPASFSGPADILQVAINQFAMDRQQGQPFYIEVWVEKDALSGVLSRVTRKYHIPIMVNRGYSSSTAMRSSFTRFMREGAEKDRPVRVIYLGDFDPSGLDMIRDIDDRIKEFKTGYDASFGGGIDDPLPEDLDFMIMPVALTMNQIRKFNPPENPAKIEDPRAGDFLKKHGGSSWEVDALRPQILHQILEGSIKGLMEMDLYEEILEKEKEGKKKLSKLKKKLK